jgi:hypothetical protein
MTLYIVVLLWSWGSDYRLSAYMSETSACKVVLSAKKNGAKIAVAYELNGDMAGLRDSRLECGEPEDSRPGAAGRK